MTDIVWNFDNFETIGGNSITALGFPKLIDTPKGRATEFDGKQDGLLLNDLPLTGFDQFTVEVIFRPEAGGLKEQRFFHMQESGSQNRVLLETRLTSDSRWFRARGIVAYGISPFKVNYYDAGTPHGSDERIRARFFADGVRLMRRIVADFCEKK